MAILLTGTPLSTTWLTGCPINCSSVYPSRRRVLGFTRRMRSSGSVTNRDSPIDRRILSTCSCACWRVMAAPNIPAAERKLTRSASLQARTRAQSSKPSTPNHLPPTSIGTRIDDRGGGDGPHRVPRAGSPASTKTSSPRPRARVHWFHSPPVQCNSACPAGGAGPDPLVQDRAHQFLPRPGPVLEEEDAADLGRATELRQHFHDRRLPGGGAQEPLRGKTNAFENLVALPQRIRHGIERLRQPLDFLRTMDGRPRR